MADEGGMFDRSLILNTPGFSFHVERENIRFYFGKLVVSLKASSLGGNEPVLTQNHLHWRTGERCGERY